ncbi:hypothetical protein MCACPph1_CDS0034 [Moorella phage MCACPph1]
MYWRHIFARHKSNMKAVSRSTIVIFIVDLFFGPEFQIMFIVRSLRLIIMVLGGITHGISIFLPGGLWYNRRNCCRSDTGYMAIFQD